MIHASKVFDDHDAGGGSNQSWIGDRKIYAPVLLTCRGIYSVPSQ